MRSMLASPFATLVPVYVIAALGMGCAAASPALVGKPAQAQTDSASVTDETQESAASSGATRRDPSSNSSEVASEEKPVRAETASERSARTDEELEASLREFDDLLLREQEAVDERRAASHSVAGSAGGGGDDANGDGALGRPPTSASEGGTGGSPDASPREPAAPGEQPGAPVGAEADERRPERVPADVGDGSDDDIVARQLREAAMAEDDPDLREKLWEEYRSYKRGTAKQRGS